MSLDGAALGKQMIGAGAAAFGNEWDTAKSFAMKGTAYPHHSCSLCNSTKCSMVQKCF